MAEMWDAYDRNCNKIDGAQLFRCEPIPAGMYHLVCDIIVKHVDGTYLLMQRDLRKTFGGTWELTAGGSALAGETSLQGAIRELGEETGIVSSNLIEIDRLIRDKFQSISVTYFCLTDCDKDSIVLQDGETMAYRWVEKSEIFNMPEESLTSLKTIRLLKELEL